MGFLYHCAATLVDFERVWSACMFTIACLIYDDLTAECTSASALDTTIERVSKIAGGWMLRMSRRQTWSKADMDLKNKFVAGVLYKHASEFLQSWTFFKYVDPSNHTGALSPASKRLLHGCKEKCCH